MALPPGATTPNPTLDRSLAHYAATVTASADDPDARAIAEVRYACLAVVRAEAALRDARAHRDAQVAAHEPDLRRIGWEEAARRIGTDARAQPLTSEGTLRGAALRGARATR